MSNKSDLLVITPVYNESGIIQQFVEDWINNLRLLSIDFEFRMYNDGSTDNTAEIINHILPNYPELKNFSKPNSGHGPTIKEAYEQAEGFNWVFQIDSDHELPVSAFKELWNLRNDYDLLLGERIQRNAPVFRVFLTTLASFLVRFLAGKQLRDINVPYRLIRSEKLKEFLQENKKNSFAPNVLMCAHAIQNKWKIVTLPIIPLRTRQLKKRGYSLYLLKGGISTALELIRFTLKS